MWVLTTNALDLLTLLSDGGGLEEKERKAAELSKMLRMACTGIFTVSPPTIIHFPSKLRQSFGRLTWEWLATRHGPDFGDHPVPLVQPQRAGHNLPQKASSP